MSGSTRTVLGAIVLVVVGVAIGVGLWTIGSPSEARRVRLDERRVDDLRRISTSVDLHWTRHGELPASLDALSPAVGMSDVPADPVTGERYGYRVIDSKTYELCATFERKADAGRYHGDQFWSHDAGRQCFPIPAKETKRGL
jgi:hypothetical protein